MTSLGPGSLLILVLMVVPSAIALMGVPSLIERGVFRPYWFLRNREYWTPISSGFLHADFAHLIFNTITFYFFGPSLERIIGTPKFLVLFLLGLLLSLLGTWRKQRNNPDYATLGASGAISAVLFASIVYMPGQSLIILPIPVPIPAPLFGVLYLAYSWWSARNARGRINHDAHLDGAITGLAFVALTDPGAYSRLIAMFTN